MRRVDHAYERAEGEGESKEPEVGDDGGGGDAGDNIKGDGCTDASEGGSSDQEQHPEGGKDYLALVILVKFVIICLANLFPIHSSQA